MAFDSRSPDSATAHRAPVTLFDRLPIWAWLVGLLVLAAGSAVIVNYVLHERALHDVLDAELRNQAQRTGHAVEVEIDGDLAQLRRLVLAFDAASTAAGTNVRTLAAASDDFERQLLEAGEAPRAIVWPAPDGVRLAVARRLPGDGRARVAVAEQRFDVARFDRIGAAHDARIALARSGRVITHSGGGDAALPATVRDASWLAPTTGQLWTRMSDGRDVWAQALAADPATTLVVVPKDFHAAFDAANARAAGVAAATLGLIAAIGVALARAMSAPLQRLATRADEIARRYAGQPPREAPPGELGRLARSFDTMTGVLVNYSDRHEQAHRQATENVAALAREHARSQLLRGLANAANRSNTAREALEVALHELAAFLDWPLGRIAMLPLEPDPAGDSLWHNTDPARFAPFVDASNTLRLHQLTGPFIGHALHTGTPHWIADLSRLHDWPRQQAASACGLASGFVVPIVARGEALAVIEFFSDERTQADAEMLDTLDAVAAELSRLAERRIAERSLHSSEADLRVMAAVASSTTSLVAVTDPDGLVTWVNDGFWRTTGYELEEVRGRPIADFVAGAVTAGSARERIAQARASGGSLFGLEVLNVRKDGSRYWTELEVQPVHNRAALLTHWIYLQNDITHRKDAEAALADSAAYFRALFDDSPLAATIQDQDRRLVRVNNAYAALLGYAIDELIGIDPFTLVHPEDRGYTDQFRAQVFAAPGITHHFERRLMRRDGHAVWVRGHTVHHVPVGRPAYTIGVLEDITSVHAQQRALREAKDLAEAANRAKSQFLANMSHEIRTPMNGVLGMTELLLGTQLTERQRRFAESAYRSGEALLEIINDILDLSKIEAGKLELERAEFNLRTLVEDLIDLHAPHADEKDIELLMHIDARVPPLLVGDPMRLRQVLANLLSNALKFTERGEVQVNVSLTAAAGAPLLVHFEVQDTGIGITREALPRLFTAFMQADQSMSRRFGGTGLGLAITRQLIELMGGRIEAESEAGRGSRFYFDLPFEAGAGQPVARGELVSLGGRRVLVVEDNQTNRAILEGHLGAFGVVVATAENGRQALELLRTAARAGELFDAALIDMHMPVMNGLAMAEAVRREPGLASLRLVMLTSLASGDEPVLAQKSGIDAFLTKPVRQQELVNVLSDLFAAAPLAAASGDGGAPTGGAAPLPATAPPAPAAVGLRVLLVEDNPVNQEVARAMLTSLGCDVAIASNGREALDVMARERFSLVMMDCQMPEMDGFEAVRRLRDDAAQGATRQTPRDVPVVAITANALAGDAERCRAAGFSDYLAKPFKQQQLAEMVQRWANIPSPQPAQDSRPADVAEDSPAELDRETLERIRDMERRGAANLLERLVAAYLEWAERLMGDGQRALDTGNADGLRQAAHTLKSASANLGALEFSRLCAELESMARDSRLQDARGLWEPARREHARVLLALRGLVGSWHGRV